MDQGNVSYLLLHSIYVPVSDYSSWTTLGTVFEREIGHSIYTAGTCLYHNYLFFFLMLLFSKPSSGFSYIEPIEPN